MSRFLSHPSPNNGRTGMTTFSFLLFVIKGVLIAPQSMQFHHLHNGLCALQRYKTDIKPIVNVVQHLYNLCFISFSLVMASATVTALLLFS